MITHAAASARFRPESGAGAGPCAVPSASGRARLARAAPWLAVPVAIGVGFPLLVASLSGSLSIPHNDDWAYSRIAETFGRTGHLRLVGWNRMFLLGRVVVLGPLGRSLVAQHLFTACMAVVALGATYALLRPRIGPRRAALAAAVLGAWPGFGLLATSFMTDVPSYGAMLASLALADAAVRRRSSRLLAAALVVGLWGATIREQSVAALLAVAVVALRDRERRRAGVALVVPVAVAALALEAWRHTLPNGDSPDVHFTGLHYVAGACVHTYFTLAAPVLPLTLASRPSSWRRRSWLAAAVVAAGGAALAARDSASFLFGNYLTPFVAYREASTGAPRLLPGWAWSVVLAAAVLSAALLAGAIVERAARLDLSILAFSVVALLFVVGELAVGQSFFDRDLLVFLPACAVVCLSGAEAPRAAASSLALVALAALGSVLLIGTLAYDSARWRAAEQVSAGPTDVDAGLEWMGTHATLPAQRPRPGDAGFDAMFPGSRNCYAVTGPGAAPAGRVVRRYRYSWLFGTETLLVSRRC